MLKFIKNVFRKEYMQCFALVLFCSAVSNVQAKPVFTFNYALKVAKINSPLVKSAIASIRSANGQFVQSKTYPNPTVNAYTENVAGSGTYKDLNAAETTVEISQPILLGGKRSANKQVKKSIIKLSKVSLLKIHARLYIMLGERYINVMYAQNWLKTTAELVKINRDIVVMLKKKLKAGSGSPLDLMTAQIQLSQSTVAHTVAKQELHTAWVRLVLLMGVKELHYKRALDIGLPHNLPSYLKFTKLLTHSPTWEAIVTKSDVAYKKIILSRKRAWPDLTVAIGVRHFSDTSDNSLVAGVSLPIPILDYNQGNIKSRLADYDASLSNQHQMMIDLKSELRELYQQAQASQYQTQTIRQSILPKAKKAILLARNGYFQGLYPYVTLANAQETLLQSEKEYWMSHAQYDRALVKIHGLLGIE
ncbi:MAG: TolC family protein [Coxiellaceae bacterium]|nr:TolC family protein [Coxiellaceae bacterium]